MPKRLSSRSKWDSFKLLLGPATGVVLTLLGFWIAYQFVDPAPPSEFTIATGSESGAYYHFAQRYRDILARDEITLHIRTTAGSQENVELLSAQEPSVEVAFVQGGIGDAEVTPDLDSVASLYFEPLWLFYRSTAQEAELTQLRDVAGKRIAVGAEGSGTRIIALQLLHDNEIFEEQASLLPLIEQEAIQVSSDNKIFEEQTSLLPLGGEEAVQGLLGGELDAVFFVSSPQSETIRELLLAPGIRVMSFRRAKAYMSFHPYLSSVSLPEGSIDFARNIPGEDVTLLAPTANLVANTQLHPTLNDLLLFAAAEVHGDRGLFEAREQFPSDEYLDFPLSKESKRYFKSGPPFLQRYLPFWAASLVDRLKVMLLPLVALLIPLGRLFPPLYRWQIRSRIYRWYKELLEVNPDPQEPMTKAERTGYHQELDRIEDEVAKVSVPLSYAQELYNLRLHIQLVRDQVEQAPTEAESA